MNDDFNKNSETAETPTPTETPTPNYSDAPTWSDPTTSPRLNPWLSIWIKPTATMKQVIKDTPEWLIVVLASVGGIVNALSRMLDGSGVLLHNGTSLVVTAIIGGSIAGMIGLAVGSLIIQWTGSWIGGRGTYDEIKTAYAWCNVTQIAALPILIISEILSSSNILYGGWMAFYIILGIILIVLGIWTFIIALKAVAVAQDFSGVKAFLNIILSGLVVGVPVFLIALLLGR